MTERLAVCDICTYELGVFDPFVATVPIKGGMFASKDPHHGYPDPFPASVDWMWMRCPMCKKRPFIEENKIKDSTGQVWTLGRSGVDPAPDPVQAVDEVQEQQPVKKGNGGKAWKSKK